MTLDPSRGGRMPRGRPPKTPAETESIRASFKAATAKAFAEQGYHGLAVEHILQHSGLSRPTFYRYFANADQVLDLVLQDVNDRLLADMQAALHAAPDPMGKIAAGLKAWRQWSDWVGPMLHAIHAALYDKNTLVAIHGQRVRDAITAQINEAVRLSGRPTLDPIQLETFMIGIEHLGYRYFTSSREPGDPERDAIRQAMLRLAIGMLGSKAEWAIAPQLAAQLGVRLD